jgi:hypothetical protein
MRALQIADLIVEPREIFLVRFVMCCDFPVVDLKEVIYPETNSHFLLQGHMGEETAAEDHKFPPWLSKAASIKENEIAKGIVALYRLLK